MKTFLLLLTSLLALSFFSCQEKEDITFRPYAHSKTSRHIPLTVGNYWIYEVSNYNLSTSTGIVQMEQDTMQVIGTATIRDQSYFQIEADSWGGSIKKDTLYWRDSLDYIVDDAGIIIFSAEDLDRVLHTQEYLPNLRVDYIVKDSTFFELTPAGLFKCMNFQGLIWRDGVLDSKRINNYYAENIGLVYQSIVFASPNSATELQRSLKEFHIEL